MRNFVNINFRYIFLDLMICITIVNVVVMILMIIMTIIKLSPAHTIYLNILIAILWIAFTSLLSHFSALVTYLNFSCLVYTFLYTSLKWHFFININLHRNISCYSFILAFLMNIQNSSKFSKADWVINFLKHWDWYK